MHVQPWVLVSLCADEYSNETVLINELCEPNFEIRMRMESSLLLIAGTKLQVVANRINSDTQLTYVKNIHLLSDLRFGPLCYYLDVIVLARMHIQLILNIKSEA